MFPSLWILQSLILENCLPYWRRKYISFFIKIYLLNARTCGWGGLICHRIDSSKFSLLSKITSSEALDLELQTKVIRRLRRFYNHGSQSATLCFTSSLSRLGCGLLLTDSAPAAAAARVSHALATLRLSPRSTHFIFHCASFYTMQWEYSNQDQWISKPTN